MPFLLIVIIAIALVFDFLNGMHASSNIVATMISSRAMPPRAALGISAAAHSIGPFLFGVAVATTIGHKVVDLDTISSAVIIVALSGAIVWNLITSYLGWPSGTSHALIGGLICVVALAEGFGTIHLARLQKVLIALFLSPVLGLVLGYLVLKAIHYLSWGATPTVNSVFKRGQWGTSVALTMSHGTNDAQRRWASLPWTWWPSAT